MTQCKHLSYMIWLYHARACIAQAWSVCSCTQQANLLSTVEMERAGYTAMYAACQCISYPQYLLPTLFQIIRWQETLSEAFCSLGVSKQDLASCTSGHLSRSTGVSARVRNAVETLSMARSKQIDNASRLTMHIWMSMQGLNTFQGGVLMVSHDQHLIESTVNELWVVEDGKVSPFHGTFSEYKKGLRTSTRGAAM